MSLQEAVERAGSFEALRLPLRAGQIMARHAGLYDAVGAIEPPGACSPSWWSTAYDIDPSTGRASFTLVGPKAEGGWERYEALAIGIELERAAVEALWPPATNAAPRHAGGAPAEHDWEGAYQHVADYVAKNGKLENRTRVAELIEDWFKHLKEKPPERKSIYRKLRNDPQPWWKE